MIKDRMKPIKLRQLEVLLRRLSTNHPQIPKVKQELAKSYQGYIGEKKVDYQLEILPNQYTILRDIYLKPINNRGFQIDSLIITDHALFIIESKNFHGTITFNTIHNQFTRDNGRGEEGYRYPLTQAETTKIKLSHWLHQQNMHNIPIYYFIAISEPSTIIQVIGDEEAIAAVVSHAEYIPQKVMQKNKAVQEKTNISPSWNRHHLGRIIEQASTEFQINILLEFDLKYSEIRTGVICPACGQFGIPRVYNGWRCHACKGKFRYAHKQALADYVLLYGNQITNRQCREFLHIQNSSRTVATNLLKKEKLHYNKKTRKWLFSPNLRSTNQIAKQT